MHHLSCLKHWIWTDLPVLWSLVWSLLRCCRGRAVLLWTSQCFYHLVCLREFQRNCENCIELPLAFNFWNLFIGPACTAFGSGKWGLCWMGQDSLVAPADLLPVFIHGFPWTYIHHYPSNLWLLVETFQNFSFFFDGRLQGTMMTALLWYAAQTHRWLVLYIYKSCISSELFPCWLMQFACSPRLQCKLRAVSPAGALSVVFGLCWKSWRKGLGLESLKNWQILLVGQLGFVMTCPNRCIPLRSLSSFCLFSFASDALRYCWVNWPWVGILNWLVHWAAQRQKCLPWVWNVSVEFSWIKWTLWDLFFFSVFRQLFGGLATWNLQPGREHSQD